MFSQQSSFRRALVVMLAVSFVWIAAACVSLCLIHSAEKRETHSSLLSIQIETSNAEDCCPITSTPICSLPERLLIVPQVSSSHQALLAVTIEPASCPAGLCS